MKKIVWEPAWPFGLKKLEVVGETHRGWILKTDRSEWDDRPSRFKWIKKNEVCDTWEEAKNVLVKQAQQNVEKYEKEIVYARRRLSRMESLKQKEF